MSTTTTTRDRGDPISNDLQFQYISVVLQTLSFNEVRRCNVLRVFIVETVRKVENATRRIGLMHAYSA